jgi:hypothetical protein
MPMSNSKRINAVNVRLVVFIFVFSLVFLFNVTGTFANDQVDPWEVRVYKKAACTDEYISYRLDIGMRHKRVDVLPQGYEKKVGCVEVGSEVKVFLYHNRFWVALDKSPNRSPDWTFAQPTCSKCKLWSSTGKVNASSLIVFPKAAGEPKGVLLWDERWGLWGTEHIHMSFFPLPEVEQDKEARYPFLGDRELDKNANLVDAYDDNVEVTLYEERNYKGASLTLPGPNGWAVARGNFSKYGWSDRAASLVVRWKGPMLGLGPKNLFNTKQGYDLPGHDYKIFYTKYSSNACDSACFNDSKCLAYTWVKPGVKGPNAVCYLKSFVPNQIQNPNCVSGVRKGASVTRLFNVNEGIDLTGQDYKYMTKGGSDDCEKACVSDSKCVAFTWVAPGVKGPDAVCYLKSGVPNATKNSNCVSGIRKGASFTGLFNINQGMDIPGQNYKSFLGKGGYDECEKACGSESKCLAFTWVQQGVQGTNPVCYLKSGVPNATQDLNCVSGWRKGISVTGLFNINQDTDRGGQDYKKFWGKGGYDECEKACGSESKCLAFTWVKPGVQGTNPVCYLKSGVPKATQNPNCVSGVRKAILVKPVGGKTPPAREAIKVVATIPQQQAVTVGEMNIDRPGMNLENFNLPSPDPKLCQNACQQKTACKAWTYVKPGIQGQSARCWLKSGVPAPLQNNCCVSGVMTSQVKQVTPIPQPRMPIRR